MSSDGSSARISIKCSSCSRRITDEGGYILLANSADHEGIYCERHVDSDGRLHFRAGGLEIATGNFIFADSDQMQGLVRINKYLARIVIYQGMERLE